MNELTLEAFAKINLYLAVGGMRPDGYHNIESVMQSVSLSDLVTVSLERSCIDDEVPVTLTVSEPSLPVDRRNLAYRAAELFLSMLDEHERAPRVRIHIEKRIPIAGGLAGGSTDAAAVLFALNALCGEPFSPEELRCAGARLGADVPFCLSGGTALALGIGEVLTPLPSLPDCRILVVRPHESVSTKEAYEKIDGLHEPVSRPPIVLMKDALARGSLADVLASAYNEFELVMPEDSEIHTVKRTLTENEAAFSMMSGSGATVFGIFTDRDSVRCASDALSKIGYDAFCAAPMPKTPAVFA